MLRGADFITRRVFVGGLGASALSTPLFAQTQTGASVKHGRGARVPPGLKHRIAEQNKHAARVKDALATDPDFAKAMNAAKPRSTADSETPPSKFDWRDHNGVTPVKDQGICGSCWVFAAIAAFESAYLIANEQAVSVSEQQGLDCAYQEMDCVLGGWHEAILLYLTTLGMVAEKDYPYRDIRTHCTSNLGERPYYALNWDYISDKLIPTDAEIKKEIWTYGPVISAVLTTDDWDDAGAIIPGEKNPKLDTDHEVLIVGWDDTVDNGVWIIKNSWGKDWGDGGFSRLPYGCNNIGFGASWVTVAPPNSVSPSLAKTLRAINTNNSLLPLFPSVSKEIRK